MDKKEISAAYAKEVVELMYEKIGLDKELDQCQEDIKLNKWKMKIGEIRKQELEREIQELKMKYEPEVKKKKLSLFDIWEAQAGEHEDGLDEDYENSKRKFEAEVKKRAELEAVEEELQLELGGSIGLGSSEDERCPIHGMELGSILLRPPVNGRCRPMYEMELGTDESEVEQEEADREAGRVQDEKVTYGEGTGGFGEVNRAVNPNPNEMVKDDSDSDIEMLYDGPRQTYPNNGKRRKMEADEAG